MANKESLAARMEKLYTMRSIRLCATVNMTPSLGSVYKGEITEYKDVRGYILFRKPADIRIQAQYPVLRSSAFDMVSNGTNSSSTLPAKNRFRGGRNDAPTIRRTSWKSAPAGASWNLCRFAPSTRPRNMSC